MNTYSPMNFLFLRGQVPQDRDPKEIVFDRIEDCDDMWTHLIFSMTREEDTTELWYWNGTREHKFSENFTERWVQSFKTYTNDFKPDVIFCRGGFPEYHDVLNRFPDAFKIYYGAGSRYLPQPGFEDYDLILHDSPEQLKICKERYPHIESTLFIKPTIDHMFKPQDIYKEYDIVFPANGSQELIKGHQFVFSTVPEKYKVLNLGNNGSIFNPPSNVIRKKVLRSQMASELQKAKIGIACCSGDIDSCPRVIPEMIACGIPIVVLHETRFWIDKYINNQTGVLATKEDFWDKVESVLENIKLFDPNQYYKNELSLIKSADFIRNKINL